MSIETFQLTVGNATTFYGFDRGSYGALVPDNVGGLPVFSLRTNRASGTVLMDFGNSGDLKVLGRDNIRLEFFFPTGRIACDLPWLESSTRYNKTDERISAAFEANNGQTFNVILSDVSVGITPEMLRQISARV